MKRVKLFEQFILEGKFDEFSGEEVSDYIEEITPDESDIPDYFISKYIKPNNGWKIKNIKLKDLLKDKVFKEYYESGEERYDDEEVNPDELYNHLVIYKGKLLDGYSRATKMMQDNEKIASAYVLEGAILESGNAIGDSRPFEQEEIKGT
jgi:hypothetical protein